MGSVGSQFYDLLQVSFSQGLFVCLFDCFLLTRDLTLALYSHFQGPLLNESSIQKLSYGLGHLSYATCEPNAARITVRCLQPGYTHHQSRRTH